MFWDLTEGRLHPALTIIHEASSLDFGELIVCWDPTAMLTADNENPKRSKSENRSLAAGLTTVADYPGDDPSGMSGGETAPLIWDPGSGAHKLPPLSGEEGPLSKMEYECSMGIKHATVSCREWSYSWKVNKRIVPLVGRFTLNAW